MTLSTKCVLFSKEKKMSHFKKWYLVPSLALSMTALSSVPVHAASDDLDLLGPEFNITGEINVGGMVNRDRDFSHNLQGSKVSLNATWNQRFRAAITLKLDHLIKENEIAINDDDFSVGEFVQEAYIEIREFAGTPVAVIVGKQAIPFGQEVQAMPFYRENPIFDLQTIDEVFGLTLSLNDGLLAQVFDQVDVSVFETNDGDFEIGRIDGVSFRVSSQIAENLSYTASYARLGNNHLTTGVEQRASLGLIGKAMDGALVGWVEGLYFSNNPEYLNSSYGITAGAMYRIHPTTDLVVEYNWVENEVREIALGTQTGLDERTTLGAEVRFRDNIGGQRDIVAGITLRYLLGNVDKPDSTTDRDYLFGSN